MLVDKTLEFSDAQALTATGVSTNVIDLGADRDIGPGKPMYIVVTVEVAPDFVTGDEVYDVQLQSGPTDTPANVIGQMEIPSNAKAGKVLFMPLPAENERYLRLNYVLAGTTPSITVSAFLTDQEPAVWSAKADAI